MTYTHAKTETRQQVKQGFNDFLSASLTIRELNVMKAHCQRVGLSFQVFTNNRLFVQLPTDSEYFTLQQLELHGITQL